MSFYQDFKSLYKSYILLFIIWLYVIVYIVINLNIVKDGNYFGGEYTRPILITAIIFLMFHMLITWDDNVEEINDYIIDLPKYKLKYGIDNLNKNNIVENNHINHQIQTIPSIPSAYTNNITQNIPQEHNIIQKSNLVNSHSLNNKYRVVNKFNNNNIDNNNIKVNNKLNNYSNDSKLNNQNIFISQKNSSKYGLKF